MRDYLIRGINEENNIKISVARTTDMVNKAREIHQTSATATAALGRALTAGALMSTMLKNDRDVLTLSFNGNGPAKGIHVVSKSNGEVKGYIGNPKADLPSRENNILDVGSLVGSKGTLTTIMDLGLREPYVGTSNLVSGEIAEDLAHYFASSEQQPSAVNLGVLVDRDLSCRASGGYIIQLMPGVSDEEIDKLEYNLAKAPAMSEMIDKKYSPEDIMKEVLDGFNMRVIEREDITYSCDCSKEKVTKALISIGEKELKEIIEEDGQAELSCHFCNEKYFYNRADLEKILLTSK